MTTLHVKAGSRQTPIAIARYRLYQALSHVLTSQQGPGIPDAFATMITPGIAASFARLSAADQQHLASTAFGLRDAGWDTGVVTAGLLHDIGKASAGPGPNVLDRGAWVILKRAWPSQATRIATRSRAPRVGLGLWELAVHAELGAEMLQQAGYSDRVCWLVRNHERTDLDDPGLRALIAADDSRPIPAVGRLT